MAPWQPGSRWSGRSGTGSLARPGRTTATTTCPRSEGNCRQNNCANSSGALYFGDMKPIAIEKARDHLELAKQAASRLALDQGFKPFEQAWSEFVAQASRIYGKLEQGAKGCNASDSWFRAKKAERKSDALLSYLHHARNSDEHGLDYITRRGADAMTLGFPETNEVKVGFEMMIDGKGGMHIRNPKIESPNGGVDRVEIVNPRVELVPVRDRGVSYNPPEMHRGRPIVNRGPDGISGLALSHLEALLEAASKLPIH